MMKHNSITPLRFTSPIRRFLSAIFIVLSIVTAFAAFGVQLGTSWTYQGQLQRSGSAYNGTCNFQFSLWDAASAGTQQGSTLLINGVNVVNGLFTVVLDFESEFAHPFTGDARWLGTSVQCSGDSGFTPLDPRQPLTAAPYALSLRPGASIINSNPTGGSALFGQSQSANGVGLAGSGGFLGVDGSSEHGNGVDGRSNDGIGVFGSSSKGVGVLGQSFGSGSAIYGESRGPGYAGQFFGPVHVTGPLSVSNTQTEGAGLSGSGDFGVIGTSTSTGGIGVNGVASGPNGIGVFGITEGSNSTGPAVYGWSSGGGPGIYGKNTGTGLAGRFTGSVVVEGNLFVQGSVSKSGGNFRIDHPLDPANKFLSHSFVESPDMMNFYNGNVTTDATGSAIVTLPDYFAALNRDSRYQLTVLGQFAQAIVSRKIAGNSFEIRTDKPGVEVSWQVTGIRQDAYAQANPIVVEESKPAEEQGLYLFPAGFGAGEEKQIGYPSRPATPQTEQKITKKTK
jgi:hypothetical protein